MGKTKEYLEYLHWRYKDNQEVLDFIKGLEEAEKEYYLTNNKNN